MKIVKMKTQIDSKEEPSKSPIISTSKLSSKIKFTANSDVSSLKNFVRAYRKEIELPINFQTSIFLSKLPQRCLQHNNILSLYCVSDKKTLCENCISKTSVHKNHQVIAISKAGDILKFDYKEAQKMVDQKIQPMIKQMIKKNEINLQKAQKQIDNLIGNVTKFYNELNVLIYSKKSQQINYYKQIKNNLKNQYTLLANQFLQVDQYLKDKLREISDRNSDQNIALNHSILTSLNKLDQIITPEIKNCQPFQLSQIQKKMSQMKVNLTNLFNFNYKITNGKNTPKKREVSPYLKKQNSLQKSKKNVLACQKYSNHRIPNGILFSPNSVLVQSTFTPRELNSRSSYKQMNPTECISLQKKDDNSTKSRKKMFEAVKEYKNQAKVITQKKNI